MANLGKVERRPYPKFLPKRCTPLGNKYTVYLKKNKNQGFTWLSITNNTKQLTDSIYINFGRSDHLQELHETILSIYETPDDGMTGLLCILTQSIFLFDLSYLI
jgi:hypothetical protein